MFMKQYLYFKVLLKRLDSKTDDDDDGTEWTQMLIKVLLQPMFLLL